MQEDKMNPIKVFGMICIIILAVNIILFAAGVISTYIFWFIIILMAFAAYYLMPKMKQKN